MTATMEAVDDGKLFLFLFESDNLELCSERSNSRLFDVVVTACSS